MSGGRLWSKLTCLDVVYIYSRVSYKVRQFVWGGGGGGGGNQHMVNHGPEV